ncbi:hypothetical protein D3C71_1515580 [compost metagenome]
MAKGIELAQRHTVAPPQGVVAQHGGNRYGQADGRHDECLAHRASHLVQRALARDADRQQGVINPPDGAQQADEGGRGSDRGQNSQAPFHALRLILNALAQDAGQKLRQTTGPVDMAGIVGVVVANGIERQMNQSRARHISG